MSTLSSASTLQQVEASYADNASYAEDNSVAKARAFVTACRLLVLKYPRSAGTPQAELTRAIDLVQRSAAGKWLYGHDTGPTSTSIGPRVTRVGFEKLPLRHFYRFPVGVVKLMYARPAAAFSPPVVVSPLVILALRKWFDHESE